MQVEISNEQIINAAAEKLLDDYGDLIEGVQEAIRSAVQNEVANAIKPTVAEAVRAAVDEAMTKEICPVDVWGEKTGAPTTIRAEILSRCRDYWIQPLNRKGKPVGRYETPTHTRAEKLVKEVTGEVVKTQIIDCVPDIVKSLRESLVQSAQSQVAKEINAKFR